MYNLSPFCQNEGDYTFIGGTNNKSDNKLHNNQPDALASLEGVNILNQPIRLRTYAKLVQIKTKNSYSIS